MSKSSSNNTVRIIAGKWRHRRLSFPDAQSLKPTQDRMKETLFNWLMPHIQGANCLDCFAGSGSLGFEALSRGANHVTFIDANKAAIQSIKHNADILLTDALSLHHLRMPTQNRVFKHKPFDIVFLDPPFFQNLISPSLFWIAETGVLKKNGLIYFEMEIDALDSLKVHQLVFIKKKCTKNIAFGLIHLV